MDRLWTPWRFDYLKSGSGDEQGQKDTCVFCSIQSDLTDDESKFVLHRASHNLIVLNIYPYISGHLLIVPYMHVSDLDDVPKAASDELMDLTKRCQTVLRETYQPQGFNIGVNLGSAAGAGIAGHVHLHIMPRWIGDANFMSTIGETRVIPEDLSTTYKKLVDQFAD